MWELGREHEEMASEKVSPSPGKGPHSRELVG